MTTQERTERQRKANEFIERYGLMEARVKALSNVVGSTYNKLFWRGVARIIVARHLGERA